MAIAFVSTSENQEEDVGTTLSVSHTVAAGDNRLLVGGASRQSGTPWVSFTFNGDSGTLDKQEVDTASTNNSVVICSLVAPDVATADATITKSDSVGWLGMGVANYTGAKQTSQPDATSSANTASGTGLSYTHTTVADDCWIMTIACATASFPAGSTNVTSRQTFDTRTLFGDSDGSVGTAGGKTVAVTFSSGRGWAASVSYAPSVAAGPANLATWNGAAKATIATLNGQTMADTGSWNGID